MIKVFYNTGSYRSGTEFLFKEVLKDAQPPDYSRILYLAPTSTYVREAQKTFHKLVTQETPGQCYVAPEMATVRQFSKKLYSSFGDKRVINDALVPVVLSLLTGKKPGFSVVLANFISDLKQLHPNIAPDLIRPYLETIFNELNIPHSVAEVVYKALDTFREYHSLMLDSGLVDEDDVLNACPGLISDLPSVEALVIDGYYDPSLPETAVLTGLIRKSQKTILSVPCDADCKGVIEGYIGLLKDNFQIEEMRPECLPAGKALPYYAYPDIEEEVEAIARKIKSLHISGKFRRLEDVVVTFPDLDKYSAMVERVFKRYGVPCENEMKKSLGSTRALIDLVCLLNSVSGGYPRPAFSQFLSSQSFSRIPDSLKKWVPYLSVKSGIVSGRKSWLDFVSGGSEILDISRIEDMAQIRSDLEWVFKKLGPLDDIRDSASFSDYAKVLSGLMQELGFLSLPSDAVSRNLLRTIRELLEQLSYLGSLHPGEVSLSRFIEVFSHLIDSSQVETQGDGVRIMDFREMQGVGPEYLYFGGLTDGDMPRSQDMDYLLPESVRKKMGLTGLDKYIGLQRFVFRNLMRSGWEVHLSFPLMSGDDMFIPSSFLYPGEQLKEKIPGIFSREEYLVGKGAGPYSDFISEVGTGPSTAGQRGPLRVTDVDAYRTCPRRFFVEKSLGLEPLSIKEYELEASTVGTIIHKIMERLVKGPFDDIDHLRDRAAVIVEDILKDKKIDAYWKELVRDTFISMLPDIYEQELEIRKDGYISTEVETGINGEPVEGIKLKGKIDRFDKIGDHVQVIDYKTGTADLTCTQVLKGNENLQLFLYAAMLKKLGCNISRVGIYSLKDMHIKWCPSKSRSKCKDGIEDYIAASLQFLEEAVKDLRKGDYTAKPLTDYICWSCHENPFCPYIQQ
ncbi:MAG: PD-(D/E)XK nuclease family protein [Deltaproteobacteria bacterium]|nr:PD-(D/E)XK nuclease family protein [Deltaproteobacteria bacterium]